jgi:hypothetical protein
MSMPPTVLLSPRAVVQLPKDEIDIPPPSALSARPGGSLLYQVLPVLLAAVGMGIILVVGNLQGAPAAPWRCSCWARYSSWAAAQAYPC